MSDPQIPSRNLHTTMKLEIKIVTKLGARDPENFSRSWKTSTCPRAKECASRSFIFVIKRSENLKILFNFVDILM
jgi:hypothetical protein